MSSKTALREREIARNTGIALYRQPTTEQLRAIAARLVAAGMAPEKAERIVKEAYHVE
jgi:hypothetical protein